MKWEDLLMQRKRYYTVLATLSVVLFLFTSCSGDRAELLGFQKDLSQVNLTWEYGFSTYTSMISFDEGVPDVAGTPRAATVSFTSPEELEGLVVKYTKDAVEASVGKAAFELPKNTGNEMYLLVRLFTLYEEEILEMETDRATFRTVINHSETEFNVTYKSGFPTGAEICWDGGDIKVTKIEKVKK